MKRLNQAMLEKTDPSRSGRPAHLRVLQFGEGNFLRAFVDEMLDRANEVVGLDAGIAVTQLTRHGSAAIARLQAQDGLYTAVLRGMVRGEPRSDARVIRSVSRMIDGYEDFDALLQCAREPQLRFVVSNSTEVGIVYTGRDAFADEPPASFPGKLTRLLYERWRAGLPGLAVLPCELIDENGGKLKKCVLQTAKQWALEADFCQWIERENAFCNTLVDRIVTGYPRGEAEKMQAQWGYLDEMIVAGEPFGLWVIEAPAWVARALPLDRAGCPVVFTDDARPFKLRKVRVLNGAHTALDCLGLLCEMQTVGDCMKDAQMRAFMQGALYAEILPCLPLDPEMLKDYAAAVLERFENPFNRHLLLDIALNSAGKFVQRVLPSIEAYQRANGRLPARLMAGFAALLKVYLENAGRAGARFALRDEDAVLAFFAALDPGEAARVLAEKICRAEALWGEDLSRIPGFCERLTRDMELLRDKGARELLSLVEEEDS